MITRGELVHLAKTRAKPAVSLYLPVDPLLRRGRKTATRLRKARMAARRLLDNGRADADLLARIEEALENWERDGAGARGLAIFASDGACRVYELATPVGEHAVLDEGYWIRPLLVAFGPVGHYYVLCLDQEAARLFRASETGLSAVTLPPATESLDAIKGKTELPADVGYHPAGSAVAGGPPEARFHSQGESPADYQQTELEGYVHGIARSVETALSGEAAPLVAVAEPNLLGMFRKHSRYPHLMHEAVAKAPSGLGDDELSEATWTIVEDELLAPRREALERVRAGHNRGDAGVVLDPASVLAYARQGRLDLLLLANSEAIAPFAESGRPEAADPTNDAVRGTLVHGGSVFVVADGELPADARLAAVLRG